MNTRTLQAPYGLRTTGAPTLLQRATVALRTELAGWIAAARTPAAPAGANLSLRSQRLLRSF